MNPWQKFPILLRNNRFFELVSAIAVLCLHAPIVAVLFLSKMQEQQEAEAKEEVSIEQIRKSVAVVEVPLKEQDLSRKEILERYRYDLRNVGEDEKRMLVAEHAGIQKESVVMIGGVYLPLKFPDDRDEDYRNRFREAFSEAIEPAKIKAHNLEGAVTGLEMMRENEARVPAAISEDLEFTVEEDGTPWLIISKKLTDWFDRFESVDAENNLEGVATLMRYMKLVSLGGLHHWEDQFVVGAEAFGEVELTRGGDKAWKNGAMVKVVEHLIDKDDDYPLYVLPSKWDFEWLDLASGGDESRCLATFILSTRQEPRHQRVVKIDGEWRFLISDPDKFSGGEIVELEGERIGIVFENEGIGEEVREFIKGEFLSSSESIEELVGESLLENVVIRGKERILVKSEFSSHAKDLYEAWEKREAFIRKLENTEGWLSESALQKMEVQKRPYLILRSSMFSQGMRNFEEEGDFGEPPKQIEALKRGYEVLESLTKNGSAFQFEPYNRSRPMLARINVKDGYRFYKPKRKEHYSRGFLTAKISFKPEAKGMGGSRRRTVDVIYHQDTWKVVVDPKL